MKKLLLIANIVMIVLCFAIFPYGVYVASSSPKPVVEGTVVVENLLPTGYIGLKYIESSGTEYIDTELAVTSNTKVNLSITFLTGKTGTETEMQAQDYNYFGSYGSWTGLALATYTANSVANLRFWNSAQTQTYAYSVGAYYEIVLNDNGEYRVNSETQTLANTTVATNSNSMYLFAAQHTGTPNQPLKAGSCRIYECKIWEGTELKAHFIPCKNPSGTVGMYDVVRAKFFDNDGSGTFNYQTF